MGPLPEIASILNGLIGEGQTIDFKKQYDITLADKQRSIVDDAVAMLNAEGGDLVIGIQEIRGGLPRLSPVQGDPDKLSRQLQDILMSNISPRPGSLLVEPVEVQGGLVLFVRVGKNHNKPYCNKQTGRYLIRRGLKNEPLLPGEVEALRLGPKKLLETLAALIPVARAEDDADQMLSKSGARLHFSILPMEAINPEFPGFNDQQSMFSRKGFITPRSGFQRFERRTAGYEVECLNFDNKATFRLSISHAWFIQSVICSPIHFREGEGRIYYGSTEEEIFSHLTNLRDLLNDENLLGPFAIAIDLMDIHTKHWGEKLFPRTPSISFGRPRMYEIFDPQELTALVVGDVRKASIAG